MNSYWYNQFLSLPITRDSFEYKRIQRLWLDKTRFSGQKGSSQRQHELCNSKHETHLTATLWENFSLFDNCHWVNEFINISGLTKFNEVVTESKWSYEWGYVKGPVHRIFDIIIHYRTASKTEGVIVIEAKNLNKEVSPKDTSPSYYLEIPPLSEFGLNRHLIYCVDQAKIEIVKAQIQASEFGVGFISWQQLASLQFTLIDGLEIDFKLKAFLKSAINYQFTSHGITPEVLPLDYLKDEPTMNQVDDISLQTHEDRLIPIWKLD